MKRLLVVDDELDMLDFLERVFRRDYEVLRASSVEEALALLAGGPVDIAITDRRMPRRGGLELLEWLAKERPATVRVLLTGYADSLINETTHQWELVDAWVNKPIDSDTLRAAVNEAVSKRAAPQAT